MSAVAHPDAIATGGKRGLGRLPARVWRLLRSLRCAAVLMALIALACIVGTLIRQEPYEAGDAAAHYGRWLGPIVGLLGLNQLYQTAWFLTLLALFALSTTACALSRLRFRLRCLGSAMAHLSILFIVAGALARGLVGQNAFLRIGVGETVDSLTTETGKVPLGFQLRLDDFEIRRNDDASDALLVKFPDDPEVRTIPVEVGKPVRVRPNGTTLEILRYLPHFVMPMTRGGEICSASNERVNPAIQVRVTDPAGQETRWLFLHFPGVHSESTRENGPLMQYARLPGSVSAYESRVTVSGEPGREPRTASILVNQPLRAGRYMLYQVDYDHETERASVLEAVYDPGVPLVFTGFVLMPLGIAFVFYVQPLLTRRRTRPNAGE